MKKKHLLINNIIYIEPTTIHISFSNSNLKIALF